MRLSELRLSSVLAAAAIVAGLLAPGRAAAQFVGDVFFAEPSVVIGAGSTGQLNVNLFSGDKPFGATWAALRFDPTKLQVVDVQAVASGAVTLAVQWKVVGGELRLVVVNGQSLQAPIGTVALARVTVRPLGNAGDQVTVTAQVRDALAADRTALRVGTGFSAQINVGARAPSSAGPDAQVLSVAGQNPALDRLAQSMRPPGHRVTLHVPAGVGVFREVQVQSIDARAASAEGRSPQLAQ